MGAVDSICSKVGGSDSRLLRARRTPANVEHFEEANCRVALEFSDLYLKE